MTTSCKCATTSPNCVSGRSPPFSSADGGHGRTVERELSRVSLDPQSAVFPDGRQFLRSRNQTESKKTSAVPPPDAPATGATSGPTEDLTRVFISSLDPGQASPEEMAQKIRAHWSCESGHWQRDALWREDACLLRNANAACALALLRTALQTLLHRAGRSSLPKVFEDVAHNPSLGLDWLLTRHLES